MNGIEHVVMAVFKGRACILVEAVVIKAKQSGGSKTRDNWQIIAVIIFPRLQMCDRLSYFDT